MFEITGEDIAQLNDEDLRSLIGRLCEYEIRHRRISPSCVTWGGNQTATDGGIDVRVALPNGVGGHGFIPRPNTGFQVKAENMPPSRIESEMKPGGKLRPAIEELAAKGGSYILVSSQGSTSDTALQRRLAAMAEVVAHVPNGSALHLDFYDRRRIETWLRDHPAQVPWVRERIENPVDGWWSFGLWSSPMEPEGSEYLVDEQLRITTRDNSDQGLSAIAGIDYIRNKLRLSKSVVRLVGLSGLGKTRLTEALFDEHVGQNHLDPFLALYTDAGRGQIPAPETFCRELLNTGKKAILVIDNCRPDLHRALSLLCRSTGSNFSLMTIEYDVQEDLPEGTDVVRLEAASDIVIENLLRRRFPRVSSLDAHKIAEVSGGNARIAIAIAGTVRPNETIAKLSDDELFRRLFEQGRGPADSLLIHSAEALSLVYSFNGEKVEHEPPGELSELAVLGDLVGQTAQQMFGYCAELERRGLVQRRDVWRAVLPQALANRLAVTALQNIPRPVLKTRFMSSGRERLLKSWSRRLGYLYGDKNAEAIVTEWLDTGILADLHQLSDLGRQVFYNIAPVAPAETLEALRRAVGNPTRSPLLLKGYLRVLRSLAYDQKHFELAVSLMVEIAADDVQNERAEGPRLLASLFQLYLSGTHASVGQRMAVIRRLLLDGNTKHNYLGGLALQAALQTAHFGSEWELHFGAQSRDHGYWPTANEALRFWRTVLTCAKEIACSNHPTAPKVREILAGRIPGLWNVGLYDDVDMVCREINAKGFWPDGWIAVRQTIRYAWNDLQPEVATKLAELEKYLYPADLVQKVRVIVLEPEVLWVGANTSADRESGVEATLKQVEDIANDLGKDVAMDQAALATLLPELVSGRSQQLWNFGSGLALAATDAQGLWGRLSAQLAATVPEKQNVQLLRGFINQLRSTSPGLANDLLDRAVGDDALGRHFPLLQSAVSIDTEGVRRLSQSLDLDRTPIRLYGVLASGGIAHPIPGRDFNMLMKKIAAKREGMDVAIHIFGMRLSHGRSSSSESEIVDLGCALVSELPLVRRNSVDDYRLGQLISASLIGERGAATARLVCQKLKGAIKRSDNYAFYHSGLLKALLSVQPLAVLEGLCDGDKDSLDAGLSIIRESSRLGEVTLDAVSEDELIAWCDRQPADRYAVAATAITPFQKSNDTGNSEWTGRALRLLNSAPDRVAVLLQFTDKFIPNTFDIPRAAIIESNTRLLDQLSIENDAALESFIASEKNRLAEAIRADHLLERDAVPRRRESFE